MLKDKCRGEKEESRVSLGKRREKGNYRKEWGCRKGERTVSTRSEGQGPRWMNVPGRPLTSPLRTGRSSRFKFPGPGTRPCWVWYLWEWGGFCGLENAGDGVPRTTCPEGVYKLQRKRWDLKSLKQNKTKQQGGTRGLLLALRKKIHPSQVPSKTRDSKPLLLVLCSSHFSCALPLWWKGDASISTPLLFRVTAGPECIYHFLFKEKKLKHGPQDYDTTKPLLWLTPLGSCPVNLKPKHQFSSITSGKLNVSSLWVIKINSHNCN